MSVELGECFKFSVGGLLYGDHLVIGFRARPEQFVELALNDCLVTGLEVLNGEKHDHGQDGGDGLQDRCQ